MKRNRKRTAEEETTYWLSYSDMMAALLLVFVLIISFTMLQAKKQFEEKEAELEAQRIIVKEQQLAAEETQKLMEEQKIIMAQQQEQLDKIIGVRSNLVEALRLEFNDTDMKVSVDPKTGAITLDSSILFDVNKYDIKKSGTEFLEEFMPRYIGVLLKTDYRDYISEIIIEGHTDTNGPYMHNLELSQERALSVARFCLKENSTVLTNEKTIELRGIITANGRSYSDPIYNEDGTVNMEASRRVEFKFRLKDEEMIDEMNNILNRD